MRSVAHIGMQQMHVSRLKRVLYPLAQLLTICCVLVQGVTKQVVLSSRTTQAVGGKPKCVQQLLRQGHHHQRHSFLTTAAASANGSSAKSSPARGKLIANFLATQLVWLTIMLVFKSSNGHSCRCDSSQSLYMGHQDAVSITASALCIACSSRSTDTDASFPRCSYDGDCPLCMREVNMLRKRDAQQNKIRFIDIADEAYKPAENADISYEQVRHRLGWRCHATPPPQAVAALGQFAGRQNHMLPCLCRPWVPSMGCSQTARSSPMSRSSGACTKLWDWAGSMHPPSWGRWAKLLTRESAIAGALCGRCMFANVNTPGRIQHLRLHALQSIWLLGQVPHADDRPP